jgi:ubiquitin carboxyl-terminal hydrolase 36/42
MPADADILCEYYITSNLKSTTTPINNKNKLLNNSDSNIKSILLESIDFIKYNKNPMDYLKTKYQLLNTSSATTSSSTTTTTNNIPTPTSTNSAQNIIKTFNKQPTTTTTNNNNNKSSSLDLSWNKIRKTGIGLLNLGNNCYLNATLQCLAYTPPLSQWLVAKTHSVTCKFKAVKGFCSLCEVEKIIYDIFNGCNGCAKPNNLCFNIRSLFTFVSKKEITL